MSGTATTRDGVPGRFGSKLTLAAIAALLAGLFALQFLGSGTLADGGFAPDFSLPRAAGAGGRVQLAELRGKVVVLDFWATTCAPCLSEMKALEELQRRMGPRGVVVLGVSAGGETREEVAAFLARRGTPYEIAVDADGAVTNAYRVRSLPTLYVLDAGGRIAASHVGYWPEAGVAEAVAAALETAR
jgi:cytochrome c biogenesis protein CcmG, thiol:disulfide interchange protein DsbE